jgi:hypothetical protein
MDKYIEELVTEMQFDVADLCNGLSYKQIGYDTKKEYFLELNGKIIELYKRLLNQESKHG